MKKITAILLTIMCILCGCGISDESVYDDTYKDIKGDYSVYSTQSASFGSEELVSGMPSHDMKFSFWKDADRAKINIKTYAKEIDEYLSQSGTSQTVVSNVTVKMTSVSETGFIVNVHYVPFNEGTCYKSSIDGYTVSIDRKNTSDPSFTDFDDGILCVAYTLAADKGYDCGIFTAQTTVEYTTHFTPEGTDEVHVLKFTSPELSTEEITLELHEF